ncbi:hypothetical protein GGI19_006194 [Coemansia pectinata]|uniref:Uncharacterized protein n=1 Tax=Coemansia pectinata TaxID=1052879 RepID=A0A9W8L7S2_9FUNG|nr:hypothetical protein GGI19_006194 [Coemansia pectinata]
MPHMVPTLLRRTFGCQFAFDDADLPEFLETLQTTKGFKSLTINVETTDSGVIASLDVVHRDGPELAKICKQLKDRLRLSKGYDGVVPGPLLFYYLATLSCVPIAQLSGTAIANMFKVVAGKGLGSLRFATKSGTRQKTKEELFVLVKNWLCDLSRFVIKGGSIKKALRMAARCRTAYLDKCKPKDSSDADVDTNLEADLDTNLDADLDPNGTFAVEMLRSNECHSRILLGIHVNELKVLLTYLPELMKGQGEDGEAAGRIDQ